MTRFIAWCDWFYCCSYFHLLGQFNFFLKLILHFFYLSLEFSFQGHLCHSLHFSLMSPLPGVGTALCHHSSPEDAFRRDKTVELSVSLTHKSSTVFQGKFVVLNCTCSGTWAQFKDLTLKCLAQSSVSSLSGLETCEELGYQEHSFLRGNLTFLLRVVGMRDCTDASKAQRDSPPEQSGRLCCLRSRSEANEFL